MWDYAELSSSAKEVGGPEALVKAIYDSGYTDGQTKGAVKTILVGIGLYVTYRAIQWGKKRWDKYREEKRLAGEIASKKLVEGINHYDAVSAHDPTKP